MDPVTSVDSSLSDKTESLILAQKTPTSVQDGKYITIVELACRQEMTMVCG